MYLKKQIGLTFLLMAALIPDGQARPVTRHAQKTPCRWQSWLMAEGKRITPKMDIRGTRGSVRVRISST